MCMPCPASAPTTPLAQVLDQRNGLRCDVLSMGRKYYDRDALELLDATLALADLTKRLETDDPEEDPR